MLNYGFAGQKEVMKKFTMKKNVNSGNFYSKRIM